MSISLYGYWRSSAAYRVRICLNLKGLAYQSLPVHLIKNGGEQHTARFHQMNPCELVPVLVDGDMTLSQSLAIIQYLDDTYADHPVLPRQGALRYQALALAQDIACEIHPLNNLRVLQYLEGTLHCDQESKLDWIHHWLKAGFDALEEKLSVHRSQMGDCCYAVTDAPGVVDICLVPQAYNAVRFGFDMADFPIIQSIVDACNELGAFRAAMPELQADAMV
ncbi:maleylacetoacetate isomerase [Vibrio sp. CAU 1672]|uniref:maleylacetoacetate isomerase n=1 Tax=Vibrio sp. CAU 1672 TaxID=3032594 RepID=UPI0023DC002C|nr:maleylacetoacetate isomerase [Vibrio sp. CAU 1672]MDF2154671.1 maleylacetoacetate isomerase [Vibrio sp. CAU 1672]